MSIEESIQQALIEAKKGNKEGARKLLSEIVRQAPGNLRAWYLLSQVVEDKEQKIFCLQKILEIQPENQQVKEQLSQLKLSASSFEDIQLHPAKKTIVEMPKKKTQWWIYALLIICVPILACMCFGMFSAGLSSKHTVNYRVEGTAQSAMISYMSDQGGTEQVNGARLPWTKSYKMDNGKPTSLVAQSGDYGRSITCIIEVDGKEWKRSTSSGDFVVVTCTGWLGLE